MPSVLNRLLMSVSCAAVIAVAPVAAQAELKVELLGRYETKVVDKGAAEIVDYDAKNKRLFIVNGHDRAIDVVDFSNPRAMKKIKSILLTSHGKTANSVAVHGNMVAVAVEANNKQANGKLVVFDLDGNLIWAVEVGALPDMVTFTPDGSYILVANEGQPSEDFKTDPEGSVSIASAKDGKVKTVSFGGLKTEDFGPSAHFPSPDGTSVAQDLEPEYIAVSADSKTAFVSLQENNAMAVIDIASGKVTKVFGLGLKNWSNFKFDVTDEDKATNLKSWPVKSMYQPDAIAAFTHDGETYIVTANEGDARDYDGYSEETRVAKLKLDTAKFPNAEDLQEDTELGRLKTTKAKGDTDGDGDHDEIIAYGARSFSIFKSDGSMVFDSGDAFTRILSEKHPSWFNSQGQESNFDNRSDDKGTEPEGVAIGVVNGTRYAFIGLERMGGVMVYDISNPSAPKFTTYISSADPKGDVEKGTAGDVAPEGLKFIAADVSPTGKAILVVANEVSGSTAAFELN
ncbi:MAG: choice-of-anchor I family protein [Pseudomonadota bacterium]